MRRLLVAIVTSGALLLAAALVLPSLASAQAGNRLPSGVTKVYITVTDPLKTMPNYHRPVRRLLTRPAVVAEVVSATDALAVARIHGACPMIMRLGPELTVVFRNASGTELAAASVAVAEGPHGQSATSACFPIHFFTTGGQSSSLLGNSWVRLMGRLVGTTLS